MSATNVVTEAGYWSDDERKSSRVPLGDRRRRSSRDADASAGDAHSGIGIGIDLGKLARALAEDERERCAYRPPHWPAETFINHEFEPCVVPKASWSCEHYSTTMFAAGESSDDLPRSGSGARRGRRAPAADTEVKESATTLYGIAVATKAMRHAYT